MFEFPLFDNIKRFLLTSDSTSDLGISECFTHGFISITLHRHILKDWVCYPVQFLMFKRLHYTATSKDYNFKIVLFRFRLRSRKHGSCFIFMNIAFAMSILLRIHEVIPLNIDGACTCNMNFCICILFYS